MTEMTTKQALELLDKQIDAAKVDLESTTAQWRAVEDRDTPEVVAKESAELQTWEERHRALLRGFLNLGYKQDRLKTFAGQVEHVLFRKHLDHVAAAKEAKEEVARDLVK